jgi:hypothetical protein
VVVDPQPLPLMHVHRCPERTAVGSERDLCRNTRQRARGAVSGHSFPRACVGCLTAREVAPCYRPGPTASFTLPTLPTCRESGSVGRLPMAVALPRRGRRKVAAQGHPLPWPTRAAQRSQS